MEDIRLFFAVYDELIRCNSDVMDFIIENLSFLSDKDFINDPKPNKFSNVLWFDWMDENQCNELFNLLDIKV